MLSTLYVEYIVRKHSNANGTEPAEPTPSVVQQILTEAQNANTTSAEAKKLATDAKDIAQSVRADADNGKFTGAKGDKGDDGITPQLKIGEDNLWQVSYDNGATWVSLGVKATGDAGKDGENGLTPYIGENGNWWVGDTDTGVSAKGPQGDPGPQGPPGEIPEDYPQIREDVSQLKEDVPKLKEDTAALKKRQNVLVGSETGNPVSCNDAYSAPLCGLTVYGKSTQDGTPSPDNPVPIVSAGDDGSIAVKVTGTNMVEGTKLGNRGNVSGVSYTANKDGISFVGKADTSFNIYLHNDIKEKLTPGVYYLTAKGLSASVSINFYQVGSFNNDVQNKEIRIVAGKEYTILLKIEKGTAVNALVVQVSLTRNKITSYSPYREQLLTLSTPNDLPGIPVTSGGNYTDQSGQQWVCDEVDLERGVKVQRVKVLDINDTSLRLYPSSNSYWYVSTFLLDSSLNNTGAKSYKAVMCQKFPVVSQSDETKYSYPVVAPYGHADRVELRFRAPEALYATIEDFRQTIVGTKVYYPLATPVETPLTPAEIAAYKALTAYSPDTVVQASDGAGIKLDYQRDVNLVVKNLEDAIASMTTT